MSKEITANLDQIAKDIRKAYYTLEGGQKLEMLFSVRNGEVIFSGHPWARNCFYTISDLERNGDFRVVLVEDDLEIVGKYYPVSPEIIQALFLL